MFHANELTWLRIFCFERFGYFITTWGIFGSCRIALHLVFRSFHFMFCYRHFRFKSWYVPAIQVRILNGLYIDRFVGWKWLKKKTVSGMKAVMALRNSSLGKIFVSYLVGRSLATECFCVKHETFVLLRTWFIGSSTHTFVCESLGLMI